MLPRPCITSECWSTITAELDRVFPDEGIALPLISLQRRHRDANPCAMIHLRDLEAVVIAQTVLVPPERQVNSAARVSVLPDTDPLVHSRVQELLHQHPRLRACGYLHSHPFATQHTWPSHGDHHGHMIPLLHHNRECGLDASFSFIACQNHEHTGWHLQAFALDGQQEVLDLGRVSIIPHAKDLLSPPRGQPLDQCMDSLGAHGFHLRKDELFDGWVRVVANPEGRYPTVILWPPDYPETTAQVFRVDRHTGTCTQWNACQPFDTARLVQWCTETDHGQQGQ